MFCKPLSSSPSFLCLLKHHCTAGSAYVWTLRPKFEILRTPAKKTMDHFFDYGLQHDTFWFDDSRQFHSENSAFAPYVRQSVPVGGSAGGGVRRSMIRRMMELLGRNWRGNGKAREPDRGRSYRHMMRERARRESQKRSYSALHSLLPLGTKSDKNSMIEAARLEIQKLQRSKQELARRNLELEATVGKEPMVLDIGGRVSDPASGIDSVLAVLNCLKHMDLKTSAIRSQFSPQQFSAFVKIHSQLEAGTVEGEVRRALIDVERKLA